LFSGQPRVYYEGNKGKWRMVRNERWKLIVIPHPDGDIFELYDHVSDPGESRNLYDELPGEAAKLWPLLQDWMRKDPDREANRTAEETQALEELDPAARQQLEVLGYIQ
jgi:arylsulfatase A-like enzyme